MKYLFGVMSCKYSLECDDNLTAFMVMSAFIGKNIPIAVYTPINKAFMPIDVLTEENIKNCNRKKHSATFKTIIKIND